MPQHLDQLDPEILRSNIMYSLTKEKNIFPVLESLIKLLGGEPHLPSTNPPPQSFARPYGHGIFYTQPSSPAVSRSSPFSTTTPAAPPQKRRKLKHVPAGAADWDVPFPFAAGEGPEAYRDTWARDRAKQLVTQLLELIQHAANRAAIKTAKSGGKASKGRTRARSCQSSRSASVETQTGQIGSSQASVRESPLYTSPNAEVAVSGTPTDSLGHYLGLLEAPSTVGSTSSGSNDGMSLDSEGAVEGSAVSCDYSAFEEWLSQLQQFVPLETNTPTPESDWGTRQSVPLGSSAASPAPEIHDPTQHGIRDEAIDPTLFGKSQQYGSAPSSQSPTLPTSSLRPGDIPHVLDFPTTPVLAHSPRTSLSSLTEPLAPLSEAFADVPTSTITHQDLVRDPLTHQPVETDRPSGPAKVSSATEPSEPPRIATAQKGKARADGSVAFTPSMSSRSTPSVVPTSRGMLDKQAILERAQERRRQLAAEIERAKLEIWETTLENAVLVHLTRDGSSM
ncbi:hypothetical protein OG21DRAFT_1449738 [Imleria badia]|nr:hypothetical protein OG21DRAFT_1449738 [Imleria badia]